MIKEKIKTTSIGLATVAKLTEYPDTNNAKLELFGPDNAHFCIWNVPSSNDKSLKALVEFLSDYSN